MSKAKKVLESFIDEGMHFDTKIRMLEASYMPVKIRLALKESGRMIENILNTEHPSPNPATAADSDILISVAEKLRFITEALKPVKVMKRRKK